MSPLLIILILALVLILGGVGLFVKGLTILVWIALALLIIWLIYWLITSISSRRRTRL